MKIQSGLFDHMVFQRDNRDLSDQPITGISNSTGAVKIRVRQNGKPIRGLDSATIGQSNRGKFTARLRGIPVGGPYDIELSIGDDTLSVQDVLVGDVWIVAGQSNMQGAGRRADACKPHKMSRAFYMDDRWDVACDPVHNMWDCVDEIHNDLIGGQRHAKDKIHGVGPSVAFAQEMHKLSSIPQGIIACAHGGTSMAQWDPALKNKGTKSLYGATIRRLQKNGGRVAGMIWYQGESDSIPEVVHLYEKRMKNLVRSLRRDTGDARLPIAIVQLSRVTAWGGVLEWNNVQDVQRRLGETDKRIAVVPAIDLALSDAIHVGGRDQQRLGKRLAGAMWSITAGRGKSKPPIALRGVSVERDKVTGLAIVVAKFDHVIGKLRAGSRPAGFFVRDAAGTDFIYDISLDSDRVFCHTGAQAADLTNIPLHYGLGTNPVCNIIDEADRSIPVFGPVQIVEPEALTPFVRSIEVSPVRPGGAKLKAIHYPSNIKSLDLRRRQFAADFCDLRADFVKGDEDGFVFYRCVLNCTEPMNLAARFGYDGPVKLWIDGKLKYQDPNGTNPAIKDKASIKFSATRGKHEVLVALS